MTGMDSTPAPSSLVGPHLRYVLDQLAGKWNVPVLLALAPGPQRFNALRASVVGISHRLLAVTLVRLEDQRLIHRQVRAHRPPVVEYRLSSGGHAFVELIAYLERWAASRVGRVLGSASASGAD